MDYCHIFMETRKHNLKFIALRSHSVSTQFRVVGVATSCL